MKRIIIILVVGFLLLLGSEAGAQFATPLDSSDVAGWKFTTFTDVDDTLKDGYQIYQKIDTTDAVIDSALGAERAATALKADSALAFTHQGIKKFHADSTSENFVFSDVFRITSADPESMFMSRQYIDDAAGGLVAQSVKGDHVDSTSEDFVFNDAYRITSEEADSAYMTKGYVDVSDDTVDTYREAIADTIQDHWAAFTSDNNTQLSEEQVEDFVGTMVDGGTETRIAVTYTDGGDGAGLLNFVVDDMNDGNASEAEISESLHVARPWLDIADDGWIGLGAAKGRIIFKDETQDTLTMWDCHIRAQTIHAMQVNAIGMYTSNGLTVAGGTVDLTAAGVALPASAVDATAEISDQIIVGDHIDSTGEDFVFDGAYHKTSEEADSAYLTHGGAAATYVTATLTEEQVEDFVGGMLGGTETNIAVTYEDGTNDIDFVVDSEPWDSLGNWGNHVNVVTDSLASWANKVNSNYDHSQDNTQAHSDYVLNSGNDVMGGTLTADGLTLGQDENITLGSQTLDHDGTSFAFNDDVVITGIIVTSDTLTKSFVIQTPDTDHDFPFWMTPKAITLIAASGVAVGGTNVVGVLMEYDNDAANPAVCNSSDWTFTTGEERTTSLSNASIDAGDYLGWKTTSVSGSVNFVTITFEYTQP